MLCHAKYACIAVGASGLTVFGCSLVRMRPLTGFLVKIILCILIPNLFMALIFRKNENYIYLKKSAVQFLKESIRAHQRSDKEH